MSPDRIAQCAQLAMLFELSSSPKPGNVDRCHDFTDINFQHFIASAVCSYPVFRDAASMQSSFGKYLLQGVYAWKEWNIPGNTHFGSLVLMIPLAMAARRPGYLRDELSAVLAKTSIEDAVDFYRAFEMAGARVVDVEKFCLRDPDSMNDLRREGRPLLDLMRLSQGHDLIAREWSTGYSRSFHLAEDMYSEIEALGISQGVARSYLQALSEEPDSLVRAKFGLAVAEQVSLWAKEALQDETLEAARSLDRELLEKDINPGSTADLVAAALFICLLKGLRF
jgi:triphosphoribosyl-dephospho-CoA synthase